MEVPWAARRTWRPRPPKKRAAATAIENHIEGGTRTAGDCAEEDTGAVVKAFDAKDGHGWLTSGAVRKAHKTWDEQVQNLMNRLSSDKAALRQGNTTLLGTDAGVGAMARTTSEVPPGSWTAGVYAAGVRSCLSKVLVSSGVTYPYSGCLRSRLRLYSISM